MATKPPKSVGKKLKPPPKGWKPKGGKTNMPTGVVKPKPPPKPAPPPPLPNPDDPNLDPAKRNAYELLKNLFKDYGLSSLAPAILKLLQTGYTSDTIMVMLQETKEYKQRFKANDLRIKAGLKVLSPAEYVTLEATYRQVLESHGLPKGFYDQHDDFTGWIGGDVSPNEINSRAEIAAEAVNTTDPFYLKALRSMGMGHGDLVAAALDRNRALPILQRVVKQSQIAGEAFRNNLSITEARAGYFASLGVTQEQARQGFQQVGENVGTADKLSDIFGQAFGQQDLEDELLGGSGLASQKRKALASREAGTFSGSGAGTKSTTRPTKGSF